MSLPTGPRSTATLLRRGAPSIEGVITLEVDVPRSWLRRSRKGLVSILQVLLGTRRLHVAADQPDARQLARELETFQVKLTQAGNETFESWRERDHDDLVLAVALACWGATS